MKRSLVVYLLVQAVYPLCLLIANQANVEFVQILPDAKISALLSNKIDIYFWHYLDVPANCAATEAYASCPAALLTVK